MNRYTFVIHVHESGPSTLENVSTNELISLRDLGAVGPEIERWLEALRAVSAPDPAPLRPRAQG
jgi:hypothetical protein